MTPERFQRVSELFEQCCEQEPSAQSTFLDQACASDDELRTQVEALLAEDRSGPDPETGLLDAPAQRGQAPPRGRRSQTPLSRPLGQMLRDLAADEPMPAQIGRYHVSGKLGAGGMGVVYRAKDERLGRDVAIKLLPTIFASQPQRVARFEREARLLAALNHTNIAAIYGLEEANGLRFLVLELVEGRTLAERLATGALPIDEALKIARQIAEAVEAAHERGVIHRDLKPANIKIAPDECVKVLDFGIAKALDLPAAGTGIRSGSEKGREGILDAAAQADGAAGLVTTEGMVVGTPGYMSPEQVRGKPLDRRTDIWSFGCVLYECLTGHRPFEGQTASDVVAKILERDPDWSRLPERTPPRVHAMLEECLEKDAKRRLRDIGDARLTLEHAIERREWTTTGAMRAMTGGRPPRRVRAAAPWLMGAVMTVLAAISLWGPWRTGAPLAEPAPGLRATMRTYLTPERPVELAFGSLALSPDGGLLAYQAGSEAGSRLFVQETRGFGAREVIEARDVALDPFLSPDGRWLGYYAVGGNLLKVPLGGGPPTQLAFIGGGLCKGADWSAEGIIYSPLPNSGLVRVPADGGSPQTLTTPNRAEREVSHRWPQVLPGGQQVLFTLKRSDIASFDDAEIALLDLASGRWRTILVGGSYARYVPTGHIVYARAGNLLAVPFDLGRGLVGGSPVAVIEGLKHDPGSGSANFAIAAQAGMLVYLPGGPINQLHELVWVDRQGRHEPTGAPLRNYGDLTFAPDGKRVALTVYGATDAVFVYDFERAALSRVTFEGNCAGPIWLPDGQRLIFNSDREGPSRGFVAPADGSAPPEPYQPADGDAAPRTIGDATNVPGAIVSPDSRWIAFASSETGQPEVFVRPIAGGAKRQVSRGGAATPLRWSPATGELFYYGYESGVGCVYAVAISGADGISNQPTKLFTLPAWADWKNYALHPDGQRFLFIKPLPPKYKTEQIVAVLNWFDELKAKAGYPNRDR